VDSELAPWGTDRSVTAKGPQVFLAAEATQAMARALSMAVAACVATAFTISSASLPKAAGLSWPKNRPPCTSPDREITGTAR